MPTEHLIVLSVPGLRVKDVDLRATPTLHAWANGGVIAELTPTFPCVTSCVQASMLTGTPPGAHGVIANGFYYRQRHEVEFWVAHHNVVEGKAVWSAMQARRPEFTSAVWHAQNIKGAAADCIVTPAPIHMPDGTMKLWCYSKPEGLYQQLVEALGHFPLQHYWGPLANIESTKWILRAAAWLIEARCPNLHWIYLPHLDYASQKFGPNSPQAKAALAELDHCLADFAARVAATSIGGGVAYLVAGEYAMTEVAGPMHANRRLREAGLLAVRAENGAEYLDLPRSAAFAMVDHQFAHVFVQPFDGGAERERRIGRVVELFRSTPGVARVLACAERSEVGLDHPRSGDVILVCDDAHWLSYYWWLDDSAAPSFARTVDIHRKPGYDPVELFFDPATKGIPLNAGLVKGSHGVPATGPQHRTALICSRVPAAVQIGRQYRDTDVKGIVLDLLGL